MPQPPLECNIGSDCWLKTTAVSNTNTLEMLKSIALRHCYGDEYPWWRHQMETFSALLALCAGNSPVTSEFPSQWPVMRSFDVFFDLHLNNRLSKQSWGWWFETSSCSLRIVIIRHQSWKRHWAFISQLIQIMALITNIVNCTLMITNQFPNTILW